MQVYIVTGGCVDDYHIIAVYRSLKKAEKRVEKVWSMFRSAHSYYALPDTSFYVPFTIYLPITDYFSMSYTSIWT